MNMTDTQLKTLLFIFWPVIAIIVFVVMTLALVIVWPTIPFSTVTRENGKINLSISPKRH